MPLYSNFSHLTATSQYREPENVSKFNACIFRSFEIINEESATNSAMDINQWNIANESNLSDSSTFGLSSIESHSFGQLALSSSNLLVTFDYGYSNSEDNIPDSWLEKDSLNEMPMRNDNCSTTNSCMYSIPVDNYNKDLFKVHYVTQLVDSQNSLGSLYNCEDSNISIFSHYNHPGKELADVFDYD